MKSKFVIWAIIALLVAGTALLLWKRSLRNQALAPVSRKAKADTAAVPANKPAQSASQANGMSARPSTVPEKARFRALPFEQQKMLLDQIGKEDTHLILQEWISADSTDHDFGKQYAIATLLERSLRRREADVGTLGEIQDFINDGSNPEIDRVFLIQVLGQTRTKAALDMLISMATTSTSTGFREAATGQIGLAGDLRWGGKFHEELSPALERVWSVSGAEALLSSVAYAMAKVGAPKGVELLLNSALATGPGLDFRSRVAAEALAVVTNPDAIPVLSARLSAQAAANSETRLASGTLAAMGYPDAVTVLLGWLRNADEGAAPLARSYVARSRTDAVLQLWNSALDPAVSFRNEKVREAIRAGLDDFQRNKSVRR